MSSIIHINSHILQLALAYWHSHQTLSIYINGIYIYTYTTIIQIHNIYTYIYIYMSIHIHIYIYIYKLSRYRLRLLHKFFMFFSYVFVLNWLLISIFYKSITSSQFGCIKKCLDSGRGDWRTDRLTDCLTD